MVNLVRLFAMALGFVAAVAKASGWDELAVKREEVFEFTHPPVVTRQGDQIAISFASRRFCDATVAIEDAAGRIIRHLACGVLGTNAPTPFQRGALNQRIVWDGKDDKGTYADQKDRLTVRVALGLKPSFERTLFWFPKRRNSRWPPLMAAQPEGVYVFDGGLAIDHVRLFSHDAQYVRTVYPFPADKIEQTLGLLWHVFPQDGKRLPVKGNYTQKTGEVYVFSWRIATNVEDDPIKPVLTVFSALPEVARRTSYDLPVGQDPARGQGLRYGTTFCAAFAELDSWADPVKF